MITYKPFWKTMKVKGESTYSLINKHNISSCTIDKLRHDKPLTTTTLNDLCLILDCPIEDVVKFEKISDKASV